MQDSIMPQYSPTLSFDVLELIVGHVFWEFQDIQTLCALLTTSKAFFHLATKRLHESPWKTASMAKNREKTIRRFTAFVLSLALPTDDEAACCLKALHKADLDTICYSSGSPSGTDYLSLIRLDLLNTRDILFPHSYRFREELDKAFFHISGKISFNSYTTQNDVPGIFRMQSATYWIIANGISSTMPVARRMARLRELKHLVIPVWELKRYMDKIIDLVNLQSVSFYHHDNIAYNIIIIDDGDDNIWKRADREETTTIKTLQAAIAFLEQYNETHGFGRIRHAGIDSVRGWAKKRHGGCVDWILQQYRRLFNLMPTTDPPTELTNTTWIRYCLSPQRDQVSLNQVTRIGPPPDLDDLNAWAIPQSQFLQKCSALQELTIIPRDKNIFRWAVKQRQADLAIRNQLAKNMGNTNTNRPIYENLSHPKTASLPRLNTLKLACRPIDAEQIANDALFAFGSTLKKFELSINFSTMSPIYNIGWDTIEEHDGNNRECRRQIEWDLHNLEYFHIMAMRGAVRLHSEILSHCPKLKWIGLYCGDFQSAPSILNEQQDLQLWHPWNSPKMKNIWLTHMSALCFHPESLDSMIELEFLTFVGPLASADYRDFIVRNTASGSYSSLETMEYADSELSIPLPLPDASLWTWMWALKSLVKLVLHGEPAFRFHLRMLRFCPSLEFISL